MHVLLKHHYSPNRILELCKFLAFDTRIRIDGRWWSASWWFNGRPFMRIKLICRGCCQRCWSRHNIHGSRAQHPPNRGLFLLTLPSLFFPPERCVPISASNLPPDKLVDFSTTEQRFRGFSWLNGWEPKVVAGNKSRPVRRRGWIASGRSLSSGVFRWLAEAIVWNDWKNSNKYVCFHLPSLKLT